jgi:hypothetical protein
MGKEPLAPKDVEWANDLLRYLIAHVRGQNVISLLPGRICIALLLKRRLEERGFWWQARIAEAWIHRAQGGEFE